MAKFCIFKVFPPTHPEYKPEFSGISLCFVYEAKTEKDGYHQYVKFLQTAQAKKEMENGVRYLKQPFEQLWAEFEFATAKIDAFVRNIEFSELHRTINLQKCIDRQLFSSQPTPNI